MICRNSFPASEPTSGCGMSIQIRDLSTPCMVHMVHAGIRWNKNVGTIEACHSLSSGARFAAWKTNKFSTKYLNIGKSSARVLVGTVSWSFRCASRPNRLSWRKWPSITRIAAWLSTSQSCGNYPFPIGSVRELQKHEQQPAQVWKTSIWFL